jgi:hypothetical protein
MDWPGADKASERIQVLQFAKGMEMGLPYQVLAEMMPQAARKFPPPQPPAPQGPPGMPPQPMQGLPPGMPQGMPPAPMPQG